MIGVDSVVLMFTNRFSRSYLLLLPLAREVVPVIKLLDDMRKAHRPCLLTGKLRMHVSSGADHVKLEKLTLQEECLSVMISSSSVLCAICVKSPLDN